LKICDKKGRKILCSSGTGKLSFSLQVLCKLARHQALKCNLSSTILRRPLAENLSFLYFIHPLPLIVLEYPPLKSTYRIAPACRKPGLQIPEWKESANCECLIEN
jgi:hypothetical protein